MQYAGSSAVKGLGLQAEQRSHVEASSVNTYRGRLFARTPMRCYQAVVTAAPRVYVSEAVNGAKVTFATWLLKNAQ